MVQIGWLLSVVYLTQRTRGMTIPLQSMRGVVWDVDGTLADSGQLGYTATNAVLTSRGFAEISEDEYLFGCRYTTPERLARHVGLRPESNEDFGSSGAELAAEFDAYYIAKVDTTTAALFPGILDLLERLEKENRPLAALTNAAVDYARAVLKVNKLDTKFTSVHGADDVPRPKPFADGLIICSQDLGLDPKHCIYIGDSPTDGAAARAASFGAALGVAWPGAANTKEKLIEAGHFDAVVTSVSELTQLLFSSET